jgi:transcriptional regulator with XRE-family HTH domain
VPIERLSERDARDFGRRLAAARKQAGLSQTDLAGRLGIERRYVSDLEQGLSNRTEGSTANPSAAVLAGIARALGMQIRIDFARSGRVIIDFVQAD